MAEQNKAFNGFQWPYFPNLAEGPLRSRAEAFIASVDWDELREYAKATRKGVDCVLLDNIGLGYNHMVRVLRFTDEIQWIARLRMPSLNAITSESTSSDLDYECHTISLVESATNVPVAHVHAFESTTLNPVKAPFMLMECLEGNVGMDLGMEVPPQHKDAFFNDLAKIHVQLSTTRLPLIGRIIGKNPDGSYKQGPIPGLGGPFKTAEEYFKAWAEHTKFGMTDERLTAACGSFAAEIVPSVKSFKQSIHDTASKLSIHNNGPFPLCHGDFGHNNVVVDDDYKVVGVIDWEFAFAAPWEVFGQFPLTLSATPSKMDLPSNYDEMGNPKDEVLAEKFRDREKYIVAVKREEKKLGLDKGFLSEVLGDSKRMAMVSAMRLYETGKPGWYSRIIDDFTSGLY